jgi:hypothetical protein
MNQRPQKLDLHDRLKKHAFEHALITTFTFGTRFFEDYALENFRSLQDNANITVLIDEGEYRDLLKAATENAESFPKQANLRYLLHPIRVPGVFHPKVFLFASKRRGLLLVGSANFTQDGLGSNAELVTAFDYEEEKNETTLPLFQSALAFFEELATRWPSEQLSSNLDALIADVPWLSKPLPETVGRELPVLLNNLDTPLWDQMVARLPGPATAVSVLSRFYDKAPTMVDHVYGSTKASRLSLYTQNGITTLTKDWLEVPAFKRGDLEVRLCRYSDGEHFQQLHGKAYAFTCGKDVMLAMGSANFTAAALRRTAKNGNIEVLLCYPPQPAREFSPAEWFDPDGKSVRVREAGQLLTAPENTDEPPLPPENHTLRIIEAVVDEGWLQLKINKEGELEAVSCRITQGTQRPFVLPVETNGATRLRCQLDEAAQKRVRTHPSVAQLGIQVAEAWTPQSLPVLVANLQDLRTGKDVRRERQIREARESPQHFMNVLTVLSSGEDEERLKQFLTYCDIPIDLPARLLRRRTPTNTTGGPEGNTLKISGAHNMRYFEALHEAVMDFAQRHHRRLDQHVERGTAKGISNFLHILLTICNLLLSQIERLVAALEADEGLELTAERWRQVRDNLDAYYWEFEKLLQVTAVDYLDALAEASSTSKFSAEFVESLPDLDELLGRAVQNQQRLLQLQQTRLIVVTPRGSITGPGFFKSIVAPANWPIFVKRLTGLQDQLKKRLAS